MVNVFIKVNYPDCECDPDVFCVNAHEFVDEEQMHKELNVIAKAVNKIDDMDHIEKAVEVMERFVELHPGASYSVVCTSIEFTITDV